VGGQYNFVAMAHAIPGGRSVLMLRSTHTRRGKATSNILWNYGYTTIPRHLRDVYVTEYGIADLRGKSDEDCVIAMLRITDARFQDELCRRAKQAGKLRAGLASQYAGAAGTGARTAARARLVHPVSVWIGFRCARAAVAASPEETAAS